VFAALFLVGWFTTGGLTPHYSAPNHDWTNWARDNQWNGRISGFLMLLAAFVFLHFLPQPSAATERWRMIERR
jgi:hypothetical protein